MPTIHRHNSASIGSNTIPSAPHSTNSTLPPTGSPRPHSPRRVTLTVSKNGKHKKITTASSTHAIDELTKSAPQPPRGVLSHDISHRYGVQKCPSTPTRNNQTLKTRPMPSLPPLRAYSNNLVGMKHSSGSMGSSGSVFKHVHERIKNKTDDVYEVEENYDVDISEKLHGSVSNSIKNNNWQSFRGTLLRIFSSILLTAFCIWERLQTRPGKRGPFWKNANNKHWKKISWFLVFAIILQTLGTIVINFEYFTTPNHDKTLKLDVFFIPEKGSQYDNSGTFSLKQRQYRSSSSSLSKNVRNKTKRQHSDDKRYDDDVIGSDDNFDDDFTNIHDHFNPFNKFNVPDNLGPVCFFRIVDHDTGDCSSTTFLSDVKHEEHDDMISRTFTSDMGWFDDYIDANGPKPSTFEACNRRYKHWNATLAENILKNSACSQKKDYYNKILFIEMYYSENHPVVIPPTTSFNLTSHSNYNNNTRQHYCKLRLVGTGATQCHKRHAMVFMNAGSIKQKNPRHRWFDDSTMPGGSSPSTWWNCRTRRRYWIDFCNKNKSNKNNGINQKATRDRTEGDDVVVEMRYSGPGIPSHVKPDGSWDILDLDGAIINLTPQRLYHHDHHSCFLMERKPPYPEPFSSPTTFCYPSIHLAFYNKNEHFRTINSSNSTTFPMLAAKDLWDVLTGHPNIVVHYPMRAILTSNPTSSTTNKRMENPDNLRRFCRVPQRQTILSSSDHVSASNNQYKRKTSSSMTYYRFLRNFAYQTTTNDDKYKNDFTSSVSPLLLMNPCTDVDEIIEMDVLLNSPKSVILYPIEHISSRLYSLYLQQYQSATNSESETHDYAIPSFRMYDQHDVTENPDKDIITNHPLRFHELVMTSNYNDNNENYNIYNNNYSSKNNNKRVLMSQIDNFTNSTNRMNDNLYSHERLATYYTRQIQMFDAFGVSEKILVVSMEQLYENVTRIWEDFASILQNRTGYDRTNLLSSINTTINEWIQKFIQDGNLSSDINRKRYFLSILNETKEFLSFLWDECEEMQNRTRWYKYRCITSGYRTFTKFVSPSIVSSFDTTQNKDEQRSILNDVYITLWYKHINEWFEVNEESNQQQKQRQILSSLLLFLQESKNAGFTSIMSDISWTPQNNDRQIQQVTWMKEACKLGLKLHVVLTLDDIATSIQNGYFTNETTTSPIAQTIQQCHTLRTTNSDKSSLHQKSGALFPVFPELIHSDIWSSIVEHVRNSIASLTKQFGSCIISITPTFDSSIGKKITSYDGSSNINFKMTLNITNQLQQRYIDWQIMHGFATSMVDAKLAPPPNMTTQQTCNPTCNPIVNLDILRWFKFVDEAIIAEQHIQLCNVVHEASAIATDISNTRKQQHKRERNSTELKYDCYVRLGRIFSTNDDLVDSNALIHLAKSKSVQGFIFPSNIILASPTWSSPSIVGFLASSIQPYKKAIRFEISAKPLLSCDSYNNNTYNFDDVDKDDNSMKWMRLHLQACLQNFNEAEGHGLGVSDLCQPIRVPRIISIFEEEEDIEVQVDNGLGQSQNKRSVVYSQLQRPFQHTAILYVPLQVFSSWFNVISGVTCNTKPIHCWHPSMDYDHIRWELYDGTTGNKSDRQVAESSSPSIDELGRCPTDILQQSLLDVWDDLRTRHQHVLVLSEEDLLQDDKILDADEIIAIHIQCSFRDEGSSKNITWKNTMSLWHQNYSDASYRNKAETFGFKIHSIYMPGKSQCDLD